MQSSTDRERILESLRASYRERQQEFDPDGLSKRYSLTQPDSQIERDEFAISTIFKGKIIRQEELEGILAKQSPALLVFWLTKRYCSLKNHTFTYHEDQGKDSKIVGYLNFNAVTFDMFSMLDTDNRLLKFKQAVQQARLVPRGSKKEFIFQADTHEENERWVIALQTTLMGSLGRQMELTSISSHDGFWKVSIQSVRQRSYFLERDFRMAAQTGDLILFRGTKRSAVLQRRLTWDQFDHVAIVLKNIRDEVLLFEATGGSGVGIFPWERLVSREWYRDQELIVHRELKLQRTKEFLEQVEDFVHNNLGCKYEYSLEKFFRRQSVEPKPGEVEQQRTYFCSELVALLYKRLGLLPSDKSSTQYWPGTFSAQRSLTLLKGKFGDASLGNETRIIFEPALLSLKSGK